jgi:5'(3')-deoxyribonucleotidase
MGQSKIFFVDVDDICALLTPVWLARYNRDYKDELLEDDLKDWGLWKYTKPECGKKIYEYLTDPHIYDTVLPRAGSKEGVNTLRSLGFRVVFATSTPIETSGVKFNWLLTHGYHPERKDYVECDDKSLLLGDFMFDDGFHNVEGFAGRAFLLTRPWNSNNFWSPRVKSWAQLISEVERHD